MSQSRIRSFFTAVADDAYLAQLQRESDEHSATRELQLQRDAVALARRALQREAGEIRGIGRPRKRPLALISIENSSGSNISTGNIIILPSSPVSSDDEPLSELSTASTTSTATTTTAAKRQRTNWLAKPELAAQIIAAVKVHQSIQQGVTALQRDEKLAGVFDTLNESTVRRWYNKRSLTVALSTEKRLADYTTPRSGLSGVLEEEKQVKALRFCMDRGGEELGEEPVAVSDRVIDSDGEEEAADGMSDGPTETE